MASIRKRGERQWEVRVRRRGYPIVCKTFETKADAEKWAGVVEADMTRKVFTDGREAEGTTLGEALERYLREVTEKKKGRQEAYVIKAWLRHPLALRPLTAVRSSDLAAYRDERLKEVGPKTVIHHLSVISHLYNVAKTEWGMEGLTNPAENVKKPRLPPGRDRRLSEDEVKRLIAAAAESDMKWLPAVIEFALETAMRRGEIVSLKWDNVDLGKRVAYLPETKNGEPRFVPLSGHAIEVLKAIPRSVDGRVFPVHPDEVTRMFQEACRRAGIENVRFHDQRHEATSRLFEKGLNPMEVATITGHKTLQMLRRYTHLRAEELAKKLG